VRGGGLFECCRVTRVWGGGTETGERSSGSESVLTKLQRLLSTHHFTAQAPTNRPPPKKRLPTLTPADVSALVPALHSRRIYHKDIYEGFAAVIKVGLMFGDV
jgi:hypothetical protein